MLLSSVWSVFVGDFCVQVLSRLGMAAVRRAARSAPEVRSSGCCSNGGLMEPAVGPASSRDPGSSLHPHPVFGQPVFYVPAPPPPPLLHCQWPMPLPYNPFPGMSYDMVVPPPPFPPPFYLRAPAYILPHPQVQPVDYRRLLHPHVCAQDASNQNPMNRSHQPQSVPPITTVSSEVQTEPERSAVGDHDAQLPPASSDSCLETASVSTCSSGSSSPKREPAGAPDYELPCCDGDHQIELADGSCSGAEKESQMEKDDAGQHQLDVSFWSVESVAPYIPSKEWLISNGLARPDEIKTPNLEHAEATREERESYKFSFCSEMFSGCMSKVHNENQSLPKENVLKAEQDILLSEQREPEEEEELTVANSEEYTLSFHPSMLSQDVPPNTEDEGECPAELSNQESLVKEQEEKSAGVPPEELVLHSPAEESAEKSDGPGLNIHELSPFKGHLVDFGVQCSELQTHRCVCEERREIRLQFINSDVNVQKDNETRTFSRNRRAQRRSCQRRNRHQRFLSMNRAAHSPPRSPEGEIQSS